MQPAPTVPILPRIVRLSEFGEQILMSAARPTFGFLTTLEDASGAVRGGYLVTNHVGRPLEFQCTTPVRASRSQQILYGATLRPYVLGELIGPALVAKSAVTPDVLLTDREPMLALREHVNLPLAYVELRSAEEAEAAPLPDGANPAAGAAGGFGGGAASPPADRPEPTLHCHAEFAEDRVHVRHRLRSAGVELDLLEPFHRIREAMEEALQPAGLS